MATSVIFTDAVQESLPAVDTTVYTCPDSATAQIIFGNCANSTGGAITLKANIVQSGGSVATTNEYIPSGTSVTAGNTDPLAEIVGVILQPGDFVSAAASATPGLNFKIGIKEVYS